MLRAHTLKLFSTATTITSAPRLVTRHLPNQRAAFFHSMATMSVVSTTNAPAAVGPYSQAIKLGDVLYLSGCIPLEPSTGAVVGGGIEAQTKQALKNMQAVLEAGGSELSKVVKTTVFLKSMDDFATVNNIYSSVFGSHKPARSCVEVARLPKDVLFEIECIASLK